MLSCIFPHISLDILSDFSILTDKPYVFNVYKQFNNYVCDILSNC